MPALTTPVYTRRTSGLESARDRWRRRAAISLQQDVPLELVRQAYLYDLDRINKGGTPMSDREAAVAIRGAMGLGGETGQGARPGGVLSPVLGFAENAARDLKDIVLGLPRLPGFLLKEPARMGDPEKGIGAMFSKGISELGQGDLSGLGKIAGAPGVRLIPGSFTAEMIGGGAEGDKGPGDLVEHPVFTFLDLLPIAYRTGMTDKVFKKVKETGAYRRARAAQPSAMTPEAVSTNRMVRQTQRLMEEGGLGDIPYGKGRMGTIQNLREYLIEWVDTFDEAEMTQIFDMLEEGTYTPGDPPPAWAVNSGRGEAFAEMVVEAKGILDWWAGHGVDINQLAVIRGEVFPLTRVVREELANIREMRHGKPKTQKKQDPAERVKSREAKRVDEYAAGISEATEALVGVDPILFSEDVTRLTTDVKGLSMPDLKVGDDVRTADESLTAAERAAEETRPKTEIVEESSPWPEDVAPLLPGEQSWLDGGRSPAATGEGIVTKATGRAPKSEAGILMSVTQKIDGEVVATNAAELARRRTAADLELRTAQATHGMNTEEAATRLKGVEGELRPGTIEEYLRTDLAFEAYDWDAQVTIQTAVNADGHPVMETMTRLEAEMRTLKQRGWTDNVEVKLADGTTAVFHRPGTPITQAKAVVSAAKETRKGLRKSLVVKGAVEAGTGPAAKAVRSRLVTVVRNDVANFLDRHVREETVSVLEPAFSPETYRLADHPAEVFRAGIDFPTRLTENELGMIRKKEIAPLVVDPSGVVWEITGPSREVVGFAGRRRVPDPDYIPQGKRIGFWTAEEVVGEWVFRDFLDRAVHESLAVAEHPFDDFDMARFQATESASLTPGMADDILAELESVAAGTPGAFSRDFDGMNSRAAQDVLDRAAEILPERLRGGVGKHKVWDPIREMAEGNYASAKISMVEPGGVAPQLADVEAAVVAAEEALAVARADHAATSGAAKEVLAKAQVVETLAKLEDQLKAKLAKVAAGEARATMREVKESAVKHPDETQLRYLYEQLDEIWDQGPGHPLYSSKEVLEVAARELEEAGITVKPSKRKAAAELGTRVKKRTKKGDPELRKVAVARVRKVRGESKAARVRQARIEGAFSYLRGVLLGTVENPGLLTRAEAHARVGEYSEARTLLGRAEKQLDSKTMREVKRLVDKEAHWDVAAQLKNLDLNVAALRRRMPTTKGAQVLRDRKARMEAGFQQATGKLEAAEGRIAALRGTIEGEMSAAQARSIKWQTSPRNLPPRWQPLYRKYVRAVLAESLLARGRPPDALQKFAFNELEQAAKAAGIKATEWKLIQTEAWEVIVALSEQGRNPVWLPHRQIGNRGRSSSKLLGDRITIPQQFRPRSALNPEPYVRNVAMAVEQATLDQLRLMGTEALYFGKGDIPGIFPTFGRTLDDLRDMYSDAIAAQAELTPNVPLENIAESIIKKDYTKVDPKKWGIAERWGPQHAITYKRMAHGAKGEEIKVQIENVYVPRGVDTTLTALQKTGGLVPFRGAYDKVMDVFRVSALALSPRFLFYNAFGGMLMLMARTDPTVLKYLGRAKEMADNGTLPPGISRGGGMVDPELIRRFGQDLGRLATDKRTGFMWGWQEGRWLGEVFNGVQRFANKSFKLNEWFDNLYRSMAYMHKADQMAARGANAAEQAEAGVRLANKILQDWDAMTPWERVAMRRVFPFYGWMKHVLKYTFTLPFDHPTRVAVLANFGAAEMEDYRSGIPQWLSHTFFIGKPGADTRQWSVSARAVNPFSDVARLVDFDAREYGSGVLIGFFTQTSPVIGALAETLGIDPFSGRTRLYPEMAYDPDRGRLRPIAPSIFETLPKSIVPQVEGVTALAELSGVASVSRDMREMRARDPDAFVGRLFTSFGMPMAPRRRSRPFEMMRAGLARDQAASEAVNRALRSGDWTNALAYESATIRGQTFKVQDLYDLAKRNPEMLEVVLSAASR